MRVLVVVLALTLCAAPTTLAQTKKAAPKRPAPAAKAPVRKAPATPPPTRVQAELTCQAEFGVGIETKRRFCDVLTGRDPAAGVLVTIPPHRGTVRLSFELHNRHTYSEELIKAGTAYRKYTATIGVLTMDNTLVERAVIQNEFRAAGDLFDRIAGGAGPGGMKAVAPSGTEFITIELPENVGEQVSLLGERLTVVRPDGVDTFSAEGRPIATISNVMVEYRPGAPPRKTATRPPG